jgi:uncharacterized protein
MSLTDLINNDIKKAMLSKENDKLEALRAVKAALLLAKTEKGAGVEIDEQAEVTILKRLVKQRKESADIYTSKDRSDLAEQELFQAGIIEKYLPEQMGEAEITAVVSAIIAELGAQGMKDMGKVMGTAAKKLSGKADNKLVSEIIKKLLDN